MNDLQGAALWAIRMALVSIGASLAQRGIGDEATWQDIAGGAVAVVGLVWSWFARKAQRAEMPQ